MTAAIPDRFERELAVNGGFRQRVLDAAATRPVIVTSEVAELVGWSAPPTANVLQWLASQQLADKLGYVHNPATDSTEAVWTVNHFGRRYAR